MFKWFKKDKKKNLPTNTNYSVLKKEPPFGNPMSGDKIQAYIDATYKEDKEKNIYYDTTATLKGFDETPQYGKKRQPKIENIKPAPKEKIGEVHKEIEEKEPKKTGEIRFSVCAYTEDAPRKQRDLYDINNRIDDPYKSLSKSIAFDYNNITTNMTFVEVLLEYIEAKGLKDPEVYTAAQIDRRLFSKIVTNTYYTPSKDTCILLAMALHLDLKQTNDLIARAGYTLSHSSKRDIVIEYFIKNQKYNIMRLNEILFDNGEKLLGKQMTM